MLSVPFAPPFFLSFFSYPLFFLFCIQSNIAYRPIFFIFICPASLRLVPCCILVFCLAWYLTPGLVVLLRKHLVVKLLGLVGGQCLFYLHPSSPLASSLSFKGSSIKRITLILYTVIVFVNNLYLLFYLYIFPIVCVYLSYLFHACIVVTLPINKLET